MRSCGICCKVFATGASKHSCPPADETPPETPTTRVRAERADRRPT